MSTVYTLLKLDSSDDQFREVKTFSSLENLFKSLEGQFSEEDINSLKLSFRLYWVSEEKLANEIDSEFEASPDMSLEIFSSELK